MKKKTVNFNDIASTTVIQLSDDSAIRKGLDAEMNINDFIHADIETSDATSLVWMISQNIGVSVLPENAVMIPTNENLCFVPIEGFTKTRELYLQWHSKRIISPAATVFMELLKDMARRHSLCAH